MLWCAWDDCDDPAAKLDAGELESHEGVVVVVHCQMLKWQGAMNDAILVLSPN